MRFIPVVIFIIMFFTSGCANRLNELKVYMKPELNGFKSFSHICKMSDGQKYFAVLGTDSGTVFIDYTDNRLEKDEIKFFPGAPSHWRECRSYNHPEGNTYAYVVTEGPDFKEFPGGIQIFKLDGNSIKLVNTYIGNFNSAHTITIDNERGLAFINGSRWQGDLNLQLQDHKDHLGGLRILDIATDPENPRDIGFYNQHYTHDSYALGMVDIPPSWKIIPNAPPDKRFIKTESRKAYIVYLADIFEGYIRVLNITDPANPVLESSVQTPLYNQNYSVHNIWVSEDKKWLFATEETAGSSLLVYDIINPIKPRFVEAYRSKEVADNSIIHNVIVRDNIAYCSWYKEGVRLIDVSDPVHPKEIAFFDSSIKNFHDNNPFHGNWSVDIDDRGFIMISDIEEGLFILRR